MGVTITVDLANSTPKDIARAAKFMLEFAGYQEPTVAPDRTMIAGQMLHPMGSLGEEAHDPTTMPPPGMAFTQSSTVALAQAIQPAAEAFTQGLVHAQAAAVGFAPGTPEAALAAVVATPPVPAATPAPATLPPPPPGIEVDAQGVPWDARIHAGSRAKIADGTWRQKRNLDPEVYKQVMDELRHTMGVERRAPQPPAPPAPQQVFAPHPPVPPVPPVLTQHDINNSPHAGLGTAPQDYSPTAHLTQYEDAGSTGNEVPPAPFVASATPPAPPISSTPPVPASAGAAPAASPGSVAGKTPTFPELVKRITAAFNAKTMTQADVSRAVQKVGLTALPMLAARPDLVGDVATELGIAL